MNLFDSTIISYVNGFSQRSWTIDNAIHFLSESPLLKGGVLVIIIWWAWFKYDKHLSNRREHITSTLVGCFIAIIAGRALALALPFRLRPLYNNDLHFLLPYEMNRNTLESWSSFPSDHMALFFALSAGLLFISRRAGVFALVYTLLFIGFPRIYLGLHYPTDIIAGAIIGMTIGWLANKSIIIGNISQSVLSWERSRPSIFYPVFFLVTYQIADMFVSSRALALEIIQLLKSLNHLI